MSANLLLPPIELLAQNNPPSAATIDQIYAEIAKDPKNSPFVIGPIESMNHPIYSKIESLAQSYSTEIQWTPSVSQSVLQLPFHPERMIIHPTDEFDGWFDEFTSPNLLLIHNEAAMIILLHELRHALHLGRHPLLPGHWFDENLQKYKQLIDLEKKRLDQAPVDLNLKKSLLGLLTRMIEAPSEIVAHQGDVFLCQKFKKPELTSYLQSIQDYKKEFLKTYKSLKSSPLTKHISVLDQIYKDLQLYMKDKNLKGF